jgi:sulfate adenylyltransferase
MKETFLISPYGGELKNLIVAAEEAEDLKAYAGMLRSIQLSARAICDLEMLAVGAFSPLETFMNRVDYQTVLDEMRLANGQVFPIPVTLQIDPETRILEGAEIALRDQKNNVLAVLSVEEIYEWDKSEYARKVLGTEDSRHPLITELNTWGKLNVSGKLRVIELPRHYDFPELRLSPHDTRERLESFGNKTVVAFQTRNPLHRAHEGLIQHALEKTGGALLLHPVAGLTKAGDINYYSRVRAYKIVTEKYYDKQKTLLAILPLAMRFAGPREALWHAIIRRNYGANHLIVGRDHAGPGTNSNGKPFYEPYAAQELVGRFSDETGVAVVPFKQFVYVTETDEYKEISETVGTIYNLSGTEIREEYLGKGRALPAWFTRPEVAQILEETYAPRHKQGVCVWLTGLSGAGKSTIAEILTVMLNGFGRRVSLLDGDVVRTNLSAGLGFDKKGRDANIRRIGFVASEIVRHGGVAVCAAISPYEETRAEVRKTIGENFIEVFVNTPLEICERRDTKGLYAKARRGEIKDFTGIDDRYEPPQKAEITIETTNQTAVEAARSIINYLNESGFIIN